MDNHQKFEELNQADLMEIVRGLSPAKVGPDFEPVDVQILAMSPATMQTVQPWRKPKG
jgi:hypothetical protein